MKTNLRRIGNLGAALLAVALPVVASAQEADSEHSELTKNMGITQKLGAELPKDAKFFDETGHERTFGSVLKGRPVLLVPISLRCQAGCLLIRDNLQKVLFHTDHPNEHKLFQKGGRNPLQVGRDLDIVFLSLDPREQSVDGATLKNDFETKVGYLAEPVTVLTGSLDQIHRVTDAIGFRYYFNPQKDVLNNATGSVLLTPDGRASTYTIGNDFQTIVLERNLEAASANKTGALADESNKFGCIQLEPSIIAKRGKIEAVYTVAGILTVIGLASYIGFSLRSERNHKRDLGGQPGGA